MAKVATTIARKPAKEMRATPTGEIVALPARDRATAGLLSETAIMSNVHDAFADYDSSSKLEGSATQRLAYAVTAKHDRLVADGATVPVLSRIAFDRQATAELLAHIREPFLGERPATPNDDASAALMTVYQRHSALLNRAVEFASVLAKSNAQMSQFNAKVGNWSVSVDALFPRGVRPMPGLVGKSVLLDGRGYGGLGKNKKGDDMFTKVNASVRQMVAAIKPAPVKAGNQTDAGQGGDAANATVAAAKKMGAAKFAEGFAGEKDRLFLIAAYRTLFADAPKNATIADFDKDEWNTLTDVVIRYDMIKQNSAKAN
jgi:hypothetical protein